MSHGHFDVELDYIGQRMEHGIATRISSISFLSVDCNLHESVRNAHCADDHDVE